MASVPKDEYRTHKEQLNNQVKYSLNIKQNNKSLCVLGHSSFLLLTYIILL